MGKSHLDQSAANTIIAIIVTTIFAVIAGIVDIVTGKIPNKITYVALVCGLILGFLPDIGVDISSCLIGLAIGFLPAVVLFMMGALGGGDVKLLAALGALLGYPQIFDLLFFSVLTGGALGLSIIVWKGRFLQTLRQFGQLIITLVYPGVPKVVPAQDLSVPFGFAIAIGTLWTLYVPALTISHHFRPLF